MKEVAPVRERGLKSAVPCSSTSRKLCRSRKGAWIEIFIIYIYIYMPFLPVAPVRERGLKCSYWLIWNEWFRSLP